MSDLYKKYVYKVSRDGSFIGLLANVSSEFDYTQPINSAGTQLTIRVAATIDNVSDSVEAIQDELGADLKDEGGADSLLIERQPDVVGSNNSNALIRTDNDIEVVEISADDPNGVVVFKGKITKWKTVFGASEDIEITVLSNGSELDNYIIQAGGYTLDQEQSFRADVTGFSGTAGPSEQIIEGQSFKFSTSGYAAKISAVIEPKINGTVADRTIIFTFGKGTPDAPVEVLYSGNFTFAYDGIAGGDWRDFAFTPVAVDGGVTYYFTMQAYDTRPSSGGYGFWFWGDNVNNAYANGAEYQNDNGVGWYARTTDIAFRAYLSGGSVVSTFLNVEVSDIVRQIVDDYVDRGGVISYSASSIDDTDVIIDYSYRLNTILEGIKKARTLAPADWYWYVDVGTDLLHFHATSTTADYTLTKGKDIADLSLEATIEERKNLVYFTGGDTGAGDNLFVSGSDTDSINAGESLGLERLTDNRVTLTATGTQIVAAFLDENAGEKYITSVTVRAGGTNDINDLKLGKTIGFANFGTLVDNLILQIVNVKKAPDYVVLSLGNLPRRANAQIEAIRRNLNEVQTVSNPDVPS